MSDVVEMPVVTMRGFTELDDGYWWATEAVLNDPVLHRRLVRTQIEEMLALYRYYPLPALGSVKQILEQLQQSYSDVEPTSRRRPFPCCGGRVQAPN